MYMNMAQQIGGIEPLLDSFFGFMRRKTDFFSGATSDEAAQETVIKAFKKNKLKADEDKKEKAAKEKKRKAEEEKRRQKIEQEKAKQQKQESEARIVDVTDDAAAAPAAPSPATAAGTSAEGSSTKDGAAKEGAENDGEGTGLVPLQNGYVHDTYRWTQSLQDLAVHVPVPAGTKAKHMVIDIKKGAMLVQVIRVGRPAAMAPAAHTHLAGDQSARRRMHARATHRSPACTHTAQARKHPQPARTRTHALIGIFTMAAASPWLWGRWLARIPS